jgi:hypothetical protein
MSNQHKTHDVVVGGNGHLLNNTCQKHNIYSIENYLRLHPVIATILMECQVQRSVRLNIGSNHSDTIYRIPRRNWRHLRTGFIHYSEGILQNAH